MSHSPEGPAVILVGVDDSATSLRAGAYAAGMARRQAAHLVVLYVMPASGLVDMVPGGAYAVAQAAEEIVAQLRARAEWAQRELGLSITVRLERGDPFVQICRVADEVRADAVVVGASMRAGHRFAGSLAVRLVRAGRWPVTVVP